jgi:hypothetical protein
MTNIFDLFDVRMGKESTDAWGTAVAQSVKLMGIEDISFTPLVTSMQIQDRRGSLQPGFQSVVQTISGTGSISGWVNYEDLPYWFDGIFGTASPVTDTDVYQYDYVGATSDAPSFSHWSLAYGDDSDDIYALFGATVQSMNISGATGEPLTYSVEFLGKEVSTDTFDSDAESDRTVTYAMGDHVDLWIDPASDAAGTTAVANKAFSFSLDINTNREAVTHLGNQSPDKVREGRPEGALNLTLELDSDTAAYMDSIINTTTTTYERVIRLKASTTDAAALPVHAQIDFNGVVLEAPQMWTDQDGVVSYDITFTGQYGATLTNWLVAQIQTGVSSLP